MVALEGDEDRSALQGALEQRHRLGIEVTLAAQRTSTERQQLAHARVGQARGASALVGDVGRDPASLIGYGQQAIAVIADD